MEQKQKGFKRFFILLPCYMAVHVFYTKILLRYVDMPMRFSVTLQMISYIVLGSIGTVLFWNELKAGLALWEEQTGKTICILLAAFVLDMLLSNLAALPMMQLDPDYQSLNEHSVAELQGKFPALLTIVALGIMGPVTEEVVFRLAPIGGAEKKSTKIVVIFAAAALFMLVHLHAFTVKEFLYNLPQFVTGLIYGTALVVSRNATIPVLLHVMNNLPALILMAL